jgi:hypothetical protein
LTDPNARSIPRSHRDTARHPRPGTRPPVVAGPSSHMSRRPNTFFPQADSDRVRRGWNVSLGERPGQCANLYVREPREAHAARRRSPTSGRSSKVRWPSSASAFLWCGVRSCQRWSRTLCAASIGASSPSHPSRTATTISSSTCSPPFLPLSSFGAQAVPGGRQTRREPTVRALMPPRPVMSRGARLDKRSLAMSTPAETVGLRILASSLRSAQRG